MEKKAFSSSQSQSSKKGAHQSRKLIKNPTVVLHEVHDVQYQQKGVVINKSTLYPTPSGVYLARVLQKTRTHPANLDPLMHLVSDVDLHGGLKNYDKEISESMSMVDACERSIRLILGMSLRAFHDVNVFVVGDGKHPMTAACLCLFLPYVVENGWKFFSIDPIMQSDIVEEAHNDANHGGVLTGRDEQSKQSPYGSMASLTPPRIKESRYRENFFKYRLMSQDFHIDEELKKLSHQANVGDSWKRFEGYNESLVCGEVAGAGGVSAAVKGFPQIGTATEVAEDKSPSTPAENKPSLTRNLSIVVACHSHAPLREFWDRVPEPKLAVTLPCCENFADLGFKPTFQYDDFEIFTPKRRIRLYGKV